METLQSVTTENFDELVLKASQTKPVIVDFWAPWCGPCRSLTPVLERVAEQKAEEITVVKVNTDENPELSARFQVRGIPAVKAFSAGEVVAHFTGAQTEAFVQDFVEKLSPSEAEQAADAAKAMFKTGRVSEAIDLYRIALSSGASDSLIMLGLAEALVVKNECEEAMGLLEDIRQGEEGWAEAQALMSEVSWRLSIKKAGGVDGVRQTYQRPDGKANDLESAYLLALVLYIEGQHREALQALLDIVTKENKALENKVKETMVTMFARLGNRSPLSDEYRTKLGRALY